jgi:RNA polymerase sigma factor for flagellar operon FliA
MGSAERAPHMSQSQRQSLAPVRDRTAALWDRYRSSADEDIRRELAGHYVSLVHFVARQMATKTSAVEYGELVGAGALGLLAALKCYDPDRGYAFTTYAVRRIRGAMLDELRSRDWMPRSSRARSRRLAAARARLQGMLLRAPSATEIARELGLDLDASWRWCDELDAPAPDAVAPAEQVVETRAPAYRDDFEAAEEGSPERQLLVKEEKARVRAAILVLPEREQQVLALCYYEEMTLQQVATVLGVTESRISQIRKQALGRLSRILEP